MSSNSQSQISISPLKSPFSLHQTSPIPDNLSLQYSQNTTTNNNKTDHNDNTLKSQDLQFTNQISLFQTNSNNNILSLSKSDSNITRNNNLNININTPGETNTNSNIPQDNEVSNLLISFSNISELEPKLTYTNNKNDLSSHTNNNNITINNTNHNHSNSHHMNVSNLSGSVIFNKDKSEIKDDVKTINEDNSLTPSLCNYYDNTPLNDNIVNHVGNNGDDKRDVKRCNLNNLYNNITVSNSSVNSKKTPIKYTKNQLLLKNEGDDVENINNNNNNNNDNKKNLLLLFNESNISVSHISNIDIIDNVSIKDNKDYLYNNTKKESIFQVENLSNVEYLQDNNNNTKSVVDDNKEKETQVCSSSNNNNTSSVRNYSNFSFDITKQSHSINNNNNCVVNKHTNYNHCSPTFIANNDQTPSNNINRIYNSSTKPNSKNLCSTASTGHNTTIKHLSSSNNNNNNNNSNSNTNKNSHIKYISSFSFIQQFTSSYSSRSTSCNNKPKRNSSSLTKTQNNVQPINNRTHSVLGGNNSLFAKAKAYSNERKKTKPKSRDHNSNNINHYKMKTMHSMMHYNNNNTKTTSTIAFIQKLKPFEILKNNTKLPLYDLIKIRKKRLSPSPINNHKRKQSSLIIHNNTNGNICSVQTHNKEKITPKDEHVKDNKYSMDHNCINTNDNSNNNEYMVVKKEMKVIKDFSKYKKKSRRNVEENEKKINNKRNVNCNKGNKIGCKSEGVQELIKGINIGFIKGNKCDCNGIYNFFKNRPVFMKQPLKMGGDQEPNIDEL